MNHPLAVYTVVYLAILFVTVSIWGSGIAQSSGDVRLLLVCTAVFSLKLAIDDYVHFQEAKARLAVDLFLSLLIYLLLAASIACAASSQGRRSAILFAMMFSVGVAWLLISGLKGTGKNRRIWWLAVNFAAIILLAWAAIAHPFQNYGSATSPLSMLLALLLADFYIGGTLVRLASASAASVGTPRVPLPTVVQCPWHPKEVGSGLLEPDRASPTTTAVKPVTAEEQAKPNIESEKART